MPKDAATAFLHGLPGSRADLDAVLPPGSLGSRPRPTVLPPQRPALTDTWLDAHPGARLIGHSLGAWAALRAAARNPGLVGSLVLVSPAAPLPLGNFLPNMAGAPVMRAARLGRNALGALTAVQALMLRLAPNKLVGLMHRGDDPGERALLGDARVVATRIEGLQAQLLRGRAAYLDAVTAYARDDGAWLGGLRCPVRILHGTADRWAPPAMADALAARLRVPVEWYEGLGHYGVLHEAMPRLCRES